jgi:hypothetical protein
MTNKPSDSDAEFRHFAEEAIKAGKEQQRQHHSETELDNIRKGLKAKLFVEDDQILEYVLALGFTSETVGVLPLIPLIQVAWSDGRVQPGEQQELFKLAAQKGINQGSEAHRLLAHFLVQRPTDAYLSSCLFVLREIFQLLPEHEASGLQDSSTAAARQSVEVSWPVWQQDRRGRARASQ